MPAAKPPIIAFVIPCSNEQAGIQHTLTYLLGDISKLERRRPSRRRAIFCWSTTAACAQPHRDGTGFRNGYSRVSGKSAIVRALDHGKPARTSPDRYRSPPTF